MVAQTTQGSVERSEQMRDSGPVLLAHFARCPLHICNNTPLGAIGRTTSSCCTHSPPTRAARKDRARTTATARPGFRHELRGIPYEGPLPRAGPLHGPQSQRRTSTNVPRRFCRACLFPDCCERVARRREMGGVCRVSDPRDKG